MKSSAYLTAFVVVAFVAGFGWFSGAYACGGCGCGPAAGANDAAAAPVTVKADAEAVTTSTVVYSIEGAKCPVGCGTAITKALKSYDGIAKFDLDKKNWLAKVTFKDGQDPEKFVEHFNEGTRFTAKAKKDEK